MSNKNKDDEELGFELSAEDLKAIAEGKSRHIVIDETASTDKTAFTIENAPIAKSVASFPIREEIRAEVNKLIKEERKKQTSKKPKKNK